MWEILIPSLVATFLCAYIVGTRFNFSVGLIKLKNKEIEEWRHQYAVMRGKYSAAKKQYTDPDIEIPDGATVAQSAHSIISMLPAKWRSMAQAFEPELVKYLSTPEGEARIKDMIAKFAKPSKEKATEDRITI